jgi:outer membrane receptor protein involved in Fe transport
MHRRSAAHPRARAVSTALAIAAAMCGAATARADDTPLAADPAASAPIALAATQRLDPVEIQGHYQNAIGTADAASEGTVGAGLVAARPTLRPAEVLEFVPGVIVTQHSGDGKANQYFLRGFNLDHGTDFATFVDGMPINMPTHAHGQGYTDLNWLIPELVARIHYRKGPYVAEDGDFATAGSARIELIDALPHGLASATLGEYQFARALLADSSRAGAGELLYALELAHNNGPWDNPERFHRANGLLRWSAAGERTRQSITATAYDAGWNATDQIPLRAVTRGLIDRFGTIDPTDGGFTNRQSLSYRFAHGFDDGLLRVDAYAIRSRLDLFSNFTFFLDHPTDLGPAADPSGIDGDQFEQSETRRVFGLHARRNWDSAWLGRETSNTIGLQVRHDRLDPVGLYASVQRRRVAVTQESRVRETSLGIYLESATQWAPWLRTIAGLRGDRYDLDVTSSIAANSGRRQAGIGSPKLAVILGPWSKTELFVNAGYGFHSNDARGTTETVTPREGLPTEPVTPLVRAKGAELGLRTEVVPGLQSSVALWQLRLDSELVFAGDAGDTQPSRASRRSGIEWNNHWIVNRHLLLDLDLALSRARFTEHDPSGDDIPGSIEKVASFGATLAALGPWSAQFQLRYFGPRPLIEDNSQRSQSTTLASLRVGYALANDTKLTLDVFNLFDKQASDIDYYYASRLRGEPAQGVNDIHFHPVEPRSARLTLTTRF